MLKEREEEKNQRGETTGAVKTENGSQEPQERHFVDIFKGKIVEDDIGSSDDDIEEKMKNKRLEKLGHSIK